MAKVDDKLLTTALQIAVEKGSVTNEMLAPQFPDHTDQALSWARIYLGDAGLLEKITTNEYQHHPGWEKLVGERGTCHPQKK